MKLKFVTTWEVTARNINTGEDRTEIVKDCVHRADAPKRAGFKEEEGWLILCICPVD